MIGQCIFVFCMLGIVILGILVMTQAITLEQLVDAAGRLFLVLLGSLITLCLLRVLLIAVILPWLLSFKNMFFWLALAALAVLALALVVRITVSKLKSRVALSGNSQWGEL